MNFISLTSTIPTTDGRSIKFELDIKALNNNKLMIN